MNAVSRREIPRWCTFFIVKSRAVLLEYILTYNVEKPPDITRIALGIRYIPGMAWRSTSVSDSCWPILSAKAVMEGTMTQMPIPTCTSSVWLDMWCPHLIRKSIKRPKRPKKLDTKIPYVKVIFCTSVNSETILKNVLSSV